MPRLFAKFNVILPGKCIYAFPEETEIKYSITLNDFEVKIILPLKRGWSNKGNHDPNWMGSIYDIFLIVSREEFEPLPSTRPEDYANFEYFLKKVHEYGEPAREITNRLIRYFRFILGTPYLNEFKSHSQFFANAEWTNEFGEIVGKGAQIAVFDITPGMNGQMNVGYLWERNQNELGNFLGKPSTFPIAEQLIDNSRTAWYDENFQRCVLELAIACEIFVKKFFFSENSLAGIAFDYLEDKAKVNVRVLEMIDGLAMATFGKSFKGEFLQDYRNIDYLFRCRNKIAHRGELSLREDSGNNITPDKGMIESWFKSVLFLKAWLQLQNFK